MEELKLTVTFKEFEERIKLLLTEYEELLQNKELHEVYTLLKFKHLFQVLIDKTDDFFLKSFSKRENKFYERFRKNPVRNVL